MPRSPLTSGSGSSRSFGWRVILFTSLAHFANDGESFFIPVLIDLVAFAYGVSYFLIAIANSLFWLSTAASAIFFGPLIDRKNLHAEGMGLGILILSVGLMLFTLALDGVSVSFFLLSSSVVAGFGSSFYHPTGAFILQSYYKGGHVGRYLGINGSAGSVGRAAYPSLLLLVGSAVASNAASIQIFGLLGIAFAAAVFLGVRGYKIPGADGGGAPRSKDGATPGGGQTIGSALTPAVALLSSISFVRSLAFYGIISFISEYITFERGAGAGLSLGALITLMYVGAIVGQFFFGRLVEVYDRRKILAASTAISALFFYVYLVTSGTLSLAALALFGFANFSGFPIFMSMASDYAPKDATATGNAIVWNLGNTGGRAAGPLFVGFIIAASSGDLTFAFEVSLLIALASALVTMKLPKPRAGAKVSMLG